MDRRTALNKNDCLAFPGLECVIDAPAGRGSSVLAYTGYYPDREAFDELGYESKVSPFASNCGQLLIDGSLEMINKMKKCELE